jgi:hypothetical protein
MLLTAIRSLDGKHLPRLSMRGSSLLPILIPTIAGVLHASVYWVRLFAKGLGCLASLNVSVLDFGARGNGFNSRDADATKFYEFGPLSQKAFDILYSSVNCLWRIYTVVAKKIQNYATNEDMGEDIRINTSETLEGRSGVPSGRKVKKQCVTEIRRGEVWRLKK